MKAYSIANPPCGIYNGDLPLGYAYYHTLLDIHSRFLRESKSLEVVCSKYSLNALGKRAEGLGLNGTIEDLDKYVIQWIKNSTLRDKINLSFSGNVLDTSKPSVEQTKETFRKLYEKGYSFREGDTFYLDVKKIQRNFDLEGIAEQINFFSSRSKGEFIRIITDTPKPIRITKERIYSVANPFGGEGISPIFGVSNLWEAYFNEGIDLMATSEKELTRYVALRFLSQVPISDKVPMKSLFIYNYVNFDEDFDWQMNELVKDEVGSDSLRYSFAKGLSLGEQRIELKKDMLKGARKLINRAERLKSIFFEKGFRSENLQNIEDEDYAKMMESFKYQTVLSKLEVELKKISSEVETSKDKEDFVTKKDILFGRYLKVIRRLSPFCPSLSKRVINQLSNK